MSINLILSMTNDYAIGRNGKLCTTSSEDFALFRKLTLGSTVVMGRLTAESLPDGPLMNRDNIVLSSKGAYRWLSKEIKLPLDHFDITKIPGEVFVIGGKSLYEEFLPLADNIFLTRFNVFCPQKDAIRLSTDFMVQIVSNYHITDRYFIPNAVFTHYSRNFS